MKVPVKYLIGIDIGTSGTKSLITSFQGRILATATVEYPVSTPRPGWSEQDPELWWQGAVVGVRPVGLAPPPPPGLDAA